MAKIRYKRDLPRVHIGHQVFDDMLSISRATRDEVGWLALVFEPQPDVYVIDGGVYVPYQESHAATVEFQPDMLASFADEFFAFPEYADNAEQAITDWNRLRVWGHSHNTMGVAASGQDQATIDALCEAVGEKFMAVRINHRGEIQADLSYPGGYTLEGLDVVLGMPDNKRQDRWKAIVNERVKRKSQIVYSKGQYGKTPPAYKSKGKDKKGAVWPGDQKGKVWTPPMLEFDEHGSCDHDWLEVEPHEGEVTPVVMCEACRLTLHGPEADAVLAALAPAKSDEHQSAMDEAIRRVLDS